MKRMMFALAAAVALASCNKQDQTTAAGNNDAAAGSTAEVVLPPSITATKAYRCKDNSVVHIDWLSDNQSANFRAEESASPVQLKAAVAGEPMTAEGYSLKGDATSTTITLAQPGIASETCRS